jgi:parallel beta-helix repeat protein
MGQHSQPRTHAQGVEALEGRTLLSSTYYVSPAGTDGGNGSASAPWKTLQYAANNVKAGDTVDVKAGTYAGFNLTSDGTAAAPITFKGEDGAVVNDHNAKTADGINLEGASYITIEGFTIKNTTGGITRAGIRSVTNDHVVVRNNTIDGCGEWGVFTGFSDDITIENNVAANSKQQHGIYVSNSGDRPIIRGNTVYGNYACGIHMNGDASMGGDGIISGALVENNIIYSNGKGGGSGINCDGVQDSRFENNLLYDNHSSGMSFYKDTSAAASTGNVIVNNTILMAADARWALNIQTASTGNVVYNNILYNNNSSRGSISISADSLKGFVSDYNVLMDRIDDDGAFQSMANWQKASGQDVHSLIATPSQLFVNVSANDYHLSASSPAANVGTSTQAPKSDREGTARPNGTGIDIGAFERKDAQTPAPQPAPQPVPPPQPPQSVPQAPASNPPHIYAPPSDSQTSTTDHAPDGITVTDPQPSQDPAQIVVKKKHRAERSHFFFQTAWHHEKWFSPSSR